jgi:hypothetical protein
VKAKRIGYVEVAGSERVRAERRIEVVCGNLRYKADFLKDDKAEGFLCHAIVVVATKGF